MVYNLYEHETIDKSLKETVVKAVEGEEYVSETKGDLKVVANRQFGWERSLMGVRDKDGNLIIEKKYYQIDFIEDHIIAWHGSYLGLEFSLCDILDLKGNILSEAEYHYVEFRTTDGENFSKTGIGVAYIDGTVENSGDIIEYYVIDRNGKKLSHDYTLITFDKGYQFLGIYDKNIIRILDENGIAVETLSE